jgi:glycosyltransferase involved in cell wall biosynthesis
VTRPRVSVVITSYNSGPYLRETLESVFAQTYPSVEVIVVDDGSTDDSVERAREFGDRLVLIERPHRGLGPARAVGMAAATGDYIACLDSDDLWAPEALAVQVEVATRNPDSGLIITDGVEFGNPDVPDHPLFAVEADELFPDSEQHELTGWFHPEFVMGNRVACPAQAFIPRAVYEAVGPVCMSPNGIQDYDYYLRISRSYPITFHRSVLAYWRFRPDSQSGDMGERALRWTTTSVQVLAREVEDAPPGTHDYVRAGYRAHVRRAAGAARYMLLMGRRPDPDYLDLLYETAGRDPVVLATRAVLALPLPAGRAVTRAARTSADALRRIRR